MSLINQLDFSDIKKKLMVKDPNIAKVWSSAAADDAIYQYKNFMYLLHKYKDSGIKFVPSIEVDEIWHHHILDTRKYYSDCINVYGYFQHHFPYFGMRGKKDFADLQSAFSQTQEIYYKEFGEYMYEVE